MNAIAIEGGDILTQQQVDNIVVQDLNSSILGCQMERGQGIQFFDGNYYLNYSCLNIVKNDENTFGVIHQTNFLTVNHEAIVNCLVTDTPQSCVNRVIILFNQQIGVFIEILKDNIESFKTSNETRQIIDALEDLDLFG